MSPAEILATLAAQNIKVTVTGDKLKLRAPGRIAPDLVAQVRHHKQNIIAVLAPPSPAPPTTETSDDELLPVGHPAYSILTVCARANVALRIDSDGALVVGKAGTKADEPGQPWSSLVVAIEAHLEAVAVLVAAGWRLRAAFPKAASA